MSKFGILPCIKNYKSETGCTFGRTCFFRHVEAEEKPSKKVKERWCERIGCIIEGVHTIGLCISRFLSEKVILREEGQLGSKHAVKFSKGTWRKIRERKGSIARNYSKVGTSWA